MENKFVNGSRDFKIWYSTISLGILLIRSPRDVHSTNNIDIIFYDVDYIELPMTVPKMMIDETKATDIKLISKKLNREIDPKNLHVFESVRKRYYIVGNLVRISQNNLELFELPFDKPNNM